MSEAFVRDDQISDIKFYLSSKKGALKLYTPEHYGSLASSEKIDCEECHVSVKPLTWGKVCQLQSVSNSVDQRTNMRAFDPDKYIQMKLKAIILDWSFKTRNIKEEEIVVPVTEENIDALHPSVANHILRIYSERFELNEEKRKNF